MAAVGDEKRLFQSRGLDRHQRRALSRRFLSLLLSNVWTRLRLEKHNLARKWFANRGKIGHTCGPKSGRLTQSACSLCLLVAHTHLCLLVGLFIGLFLCWLTWLSDESSLLFCPLFPSRLVSSFLLYSCLFCCHILSTFQHLLSSILFSSLLFSCHLFLSLSSPLLSSSPLLPSPL